MKISIITVCYNSCNTIARTIESVLKQTDVTLEYIIIDGASKDNTVSISQSYITEFQKKNISYIIQSEPDQGFYDAMNKGIKLASGDIVGILNSDDYYASPDVLSSVIKGFEDYQTDTLYGNLLYVKGQKPYRYWKSGKFSTFKYGWMPPHPSFFVKKTVYEKFGLFRLDCGTAADYELMLRMLEKNKVSTVWINKLYVYMEAGGASGANIDAYKKAHYKDVYAWQVNGIKPKKLTVWLKKIRKLKQFYIPKSIKKDFYKKKINL